MSILIAWAFIVVCLALWDLGKLLTRPCARCAIKQVERDALARMQEVCESW